MPVTKRADDVVESVKEVLGKLADSDSIIVKMCKLPYYLSCFLLDENNNPDDVILIYKKVSNGRWCSWTPPPQWITLIEL